MVDRQVDFAQIDASHLLALWGGLWVFLMVGSDGFVLCACPVDDDRLGQVPGPVQEERLVAFAIREAQESIVQAHRRAFVFDTKVPLALA